jgi:hypothetical protein
VPPSEQVVLLPPMSPIPQVDLVKLTVFEKISRFYLICDRRNNLSNNDIKPTLEKIIFGLINKTRSNLMKDGNHKNRFDINAKKVLRATRAYYDHKLEFTYEFKKLRRRISRSTILDPKLNKGFVYYMDQLTEKMFPIQLLELFKVDKVSLSNHLAAIVCPKAF